MVVQERFCKVLQRDNHRTQGALKKLLVCFLVWVTMMNMVMVINMLMTMLSFFYLDVGEDNNALD